MRGEFDVTIQREKDGNRERKMAEAPKIELFVKVRTEILEMWHAFKRICFKYAENLFSSNFWLSLIHYHKFISWYCARLSNKVCLIKNQCLETHSHSQHTFHRYLQLRAVASVLSPILKCPVSKMLQLSKSIISLYKHIHVYIYMWSDMM